jgi:hypothetical protein
MTNKISESTFWPADIQDMHTKFKVNEVIRSLDKEKLAKFLEFRLNFLQEELDEKQAECNAHAAITKIVEVRLKRLEVKLHELLGIAEGKEHGS